MNIKSIAHSITTALAIATTLPAHAGIDIDATGAPPCSSPARTACRSVT
jgi:hypothetical protein